MALVGMGCLRLSCHLMQLVKKVTAVVEKAVFWYAQGCQRPYLSCLNHHHRLQLVKPVLQGTCMHTTVNGTLYLYGYGVQSRPVIRLDVVRDGRSS
jgi:hypothetical protein